MLHRNAVIRGTMRRDVVRLCVGVGLGALKVQDWTLKDGF